MVHLTARPATQCLALHSAASYLRTATERSRTSAVVHQDEQIDQIGMIPRDRCSPKNIAFELLAGPALAQWQKTKPEPNADCQAAGYIFFPDWTERVNDLSSDTELLAADEIMGATYTPNKFGQSCTETPGCVGFDSLFHFKLMISFTNVTDLQVRVRLTGHTGIDSCTTRSCPGQRMRVCHTPSDAEPPVCTEYSHTVAHAAGM